jgi:hypothetical protein
VISFFAATFAYMSGAATDATIETSAPFKKFTNANSLRMQVSNKQYTAIVIGLTVVAMMLVTRLRYCGAFALPEKPGKPVATVSNAQDVSDRIELSNDAYRTYLKRDTETFGIPAVVEQQMTAVFPHQEDRQAHVLAPGDFVEVLGMKLTLTVEKVSGSSTNQMMLAIENLGHKPLAYRVQTRLSSGEGACTRARQVRHNALAVPASGTVKRTECIYRKDRTLEITAVETIELPELGFLYLSSMDARNFALAERTVGMHVVPLDAMACRVPQAATLRKAILAGNVSWRDQADFYARHRCQTYSMPVTYKAFQEDGEHSLPFGGGDL